jgi:hypothetical protein
MSFAPETHPRAASLDLWRHFRAFLCTIVNIFGDPETLAARHTLLRTEWRLTNTWIKVAEALLRRLLLIEAAAILLLPASASRPKKMPRARKLVTFYPDKPEDWRVHFCCLLDRRQRERQARSSRKRPSRFASAWVLALRLEALQRVFNDPHAYAVRLARRLRRAPADAQKLFTTPAKLARFTDPDALEAYDLAASGAALVFNTS